MKKSSLIATTALGMVLGAVLFNAKTAQAQFAVIDVAGHRPGHQERRR